MQLNMIFSALTAILAFSTFCCGNSWQANEYLDDEKDFRVFWNTTSTHVIFKLSVNTTGWIGIGFRGNSDDAHADIHVGWVKNGKAVITDRHGESFDGFPQLDQKQDLELLSGEECNGTTSIMFQRQLAACEKDQDQPLSDSTLRVIYAYGRKDPEDEKFNLADYHLQHSGAKSILLLNNQNQQMDYDASDDVSSFSVLNDGSMMSTASTYYHCKVVQIPLITTKHHIIKIEPVIENKNKKNIHHMVAHACPPVLPNPEEASRGGDCYRGTLQDYRYCISLMAGWAVGGGAVIFPDDVGFPIGHASQTRNIKLEIHYNNPENRNIIDHSGFKFTYTTRTRKHDAGMVLLGHHLAGYNMLIPPRTPDFNVYATCEAECLGGAMNMAGVDAINVFAAFFHTHVAGRKVSLHHFRNETELAPVASDITYDYNFQETRKISPRKEIRKGDSLQTVCTYTTKDKETFVEGGLEKSEEMCASFLYYYPRIPLAICNSGPATGFKIISNMVGVKAVRPYNAHPIYFNNRFRHLMITSPKDLANQTLDVALNNHNWTDYERNLLSDQLRDAPINQMCAGPQPLLPYFYNLPPFPKYKPYFSASQPVCLKSNTTLSTSLVAMDCTATSEKKEI